MPISFQKMDGFYRLRFSDKKIVKTQQNTNIFTHYNTDGEIVPIDYYPQGED